MFDLYIDILNRVCRKGPYDATPVGEIDLRANDTPVFNIYFLKPTTDPRAPFAVTRYAAATISMQLLDAANAPQATQGSWTEIAPAVTAPAITHPKSGDATHGQYDRVTFASAPGSGNFALIMSGGAIAESGASSGTAKVYPGMTSEMEIAAAFASMAGAPFSVAFVGPTIIDIHGNAVANPASLTEVNVSNLQYLFGWTASLAMTGAGVPPIAAFDGDTPEVTLLVKLTPSGGAATTVLKMPVNLFS